MERSIQPARPSAESRTWIWVLITLVLLFTIGWAIIGDYYSVKATQETEQGAPLPGPVPN